MSHKRTDSAGIAYYGRNLAEGKDKIGALRCMKRRLSDAIYRALVDDLTRAEVAGPEGQPGATRDSSATARSPMDSTSERSLTGPAAPNATPTRTPIKRAC